MSRQIVDAEESEAKMISGDAPFQVKDLITNTLRQKIYEKIQIKSVFQIDLTNPTQGEIQLVLKSRGEELFSSAWELYEQNPTMSYQLPGDIWNNRLVLMYEQHPKEQVRLFLEILKLAEFSSKNAYYLSISNMNDYTLFTLMDSSYDARTEEWLMLEVENSPDRDFRPESQYIFNRTLSKLQKERPATSTFKNWYLNELIAPQVVGIGNRLFGQLGLLIDNMFPPHNPFAYPDLPKPSVWHRRGFKLPKEIPDKLTPGTLALVGWKITTFPMIN